MLAVQACASFRAARKLPPSAMPFALQAIFSATWTGPRGTGLACTAESLADACATFLSHALRPFNTMCFGMLLG